MIRIINGHHVFGSSSLGRVMECPASGVLAILHPEIVGLKKGSASADEGVLAHGVARFLLSGDDSEITSPVPSDMNDFVQQYVDYVLEFGKPCMVERGVKFPFVDDECFGTVDAVVLVGDICHVFDLKYGSYIKVRAEGNYQLMSFAAGLRLLPDFQNVKTFVLHIVQPRMDNLSTWAVSAIEADFMADVFRDKIAEIESCAASNTIPDDMFCPSDETCLNKFCPVKAVCRKKNTELAVTMESAVSTPLEAITPDRISEILSKAASVKKFIEAVEEYALYLAETGVDIPGFELTTKKSNAKWREKAAVLDAMRRQGAEPAIEYICPTVTEGRKIFSKETLETLLAEREDKPTLVRSQN